MLASRGGEVQLRTPRERNAVAYDLARAGRGVLAIEAVVADETDAMPAVSFFGRRRDESGYWSPQEELRIYEDGDVTKLTIGDEGMRAAPENLSSREIEALGLAVTAIARHLN